MLRDIAGIKLLGANFNPTSTLKLFEYKEKNNIKISKVSLVYGKNGTGKSTISRAFQKMAGSNEAYINTVEPIDCNDKTVVLTEEEKKQIFVFNEDYIDNNIRLHEENLETIVILGEQKDIEDQIIEKRKKLEEEQRKFDKQREICDEYCDDTNMTSPMFYKKQMILALKGDGNWADRDSKIKGNKTATSVKGDIYQKFINLNPQKTRDELIVEFNLKFTEYENIKNGPKTIDSPVKTDYQITFDEEKFISLLAKKVEEPNLSEREKFLIDLVEKRGSLISKR